MRRDVGALIPYGRNDPFFQAPVASISGVKTPNSSPVMLASSTAFFTSSPLSVRAYVTSSLSMYLKGEDEAPLFFAI